MLDGIAPQQGYDSTLDASIDAALDWLATAQDPDGFWAGTLESNCCIEAEWLLAFHVLGYAHPERRRIVLGILDRQRGDGAWETYYAAPCGDINATVECYAALRASGMAPTEAPLRRAREWLQAHGGLRQTRVFTRYWLALIGEWPWQATPNLPPEVIRFPTWFPFSIYNFASWARATLVPLCVLSARRYCVPLPADRRLDELFPGGREAFDYSLPARGAKFSWAGFFRAADRVLHRLQDLGCTPGRRAAVSRCIEWVVRHQDADGAWGGIQPPWIWSLLAVHAEGFGVDHPVIARGLAALDGYWSYRHGAGLRIQASESPVWDTALALLAMVDCGVTLPQRPVLQRGVEWLIRQVVRTRGDWCVRVADVEPGGWAFERANAHYPDVDDTAVVMTALLRINGGPASAAVEAAVDRARRWLLAMQCRNGGWAAFDRDNDRAILTKIPFCDFGETIDPPSVDVTAHVLEALGVLGVDRQHPAVARGIEFIRSEQEAGGSWFGRWGVNHIYGTAAVLQGLRAIGENMEADYVRRAARWLARCQNPDGGWGESCASYMDAAWIGRGPSTASQTGWAVLGLLSVSAAEFGLPIARGVHYLISTQRDSTWDEPWYTGTGFPGYGVGARLALDDLTLAGRLNQGAELQRGFMINYRLYRHYFPLAALGRARQAGIAPRAP